MAGAAISQHIFCETVLHISIGGNEMAWIELHQSLRDHRKVLQASDELDIEPAHMVGLLSLLWLWAIDNAESGDLSRVTSKTLARAAQWTGNADSFVEVLKRTSFIDSDTLMLHDWLDFSGRLLEQREQKRAQNRLRQQRFRENQARQQPSKSNADITDVSQKNNALLSDSTKPNQTVPNRINNTNAPRKGQGRKQQNSSGAEDDLFTGYEFSQNMITKLNQWLEYKRERRKTYKPTGLKAFLTGIQNKLSIHSEVEIMALIDDCMSNNYEGVIWDKLKSYAPPNGGQQHEQSRFSRDV